MVASIGPLDGSAAVAAPAPEQQQPAAAEPPPPKKAAPKKAAKAAAAAPAAAAPAAPAAAAGRTPSIRFPPRRAPSGEQLSTLPRERAAALLAQLVAGEGASGGDGAASQRAAVPDQYKHMIAVPIVGGSMPILRGMAVPAGPPGPPRRTMTDAEMEAIMLGGADP